MLGLYPTWFEPGVGSGWIIGFIATIHVLFSHASVGGAVLFAWHANFAVRRDQPAYLAFIRRYGLFLLSFSYVLGSGHLVRRHDRVPPRDLGAHPLLRLALGERMGVLRH